MGRKKKKGLRDRPVVAAKSYLLVFGVNLRYLRHCMGMSLLDANLAYSGMENRVGIALSRLSAVERGKVNITTETLCRLSAYWSVSVNIMISVILEDDDKQRNYDRRTVAAREKEIRVAKRKGLEW